MGSYQLTKAWTEVSETNNTEQPPAKTCGDCLYRKFTKKSIGFVCKINPPPWYSVLEDEIACGKYRKKFK